MTREKIIERIERYIPWADEYEVDIEVLTGALELLKKEPCGDLISRQAVLDIDFHKLIHTTTKPAEMIRQKIKQLPLVNPQEPNTGHWIPVSERLPEDSGEYLITIKDRTYLEISWFYPSNKEWSYRNAEIVAWMPLPKPYEPQESEDKDADKKCTYKETGCGSCKRQLDCPIEADTSESEE